MPIYEYRFFFFFFCAGQCGAHFELLRSYNQSDSSAECSALPGLETRRELSRVNAFSGGKSLTDSGWPLRRLLWRQLQHLRTLAMKNLNGKLAF